MKVTVKLNHWYALGVVPERGFQYEAMLLNDKGQQCCLGFCALTHGVDTSLIRFVPSPERIRQLLPNDDWMTKGCTPLSASPLAELAMLLNDGSADYDNGGKCYWEDQPLEVRMGNLITVFAEGGDDLEFVL